MMNKKIIFEMFIGGLIVFLFVSCGGGGDGGGGVGVTPPAQSLTGTYNLTGFTVSYSNGVTFTEKDLSSWSGEMIIGEDTLTQTFVLESNPIALTGTATVTYTNGTTEGIAHVTDQTGTHDVYFTCSGNNLNTYSGVIVFDPSLSFEEWDYWVKVTDAVSTSATIKTMNQTSKSNFKWIGEVINPSKK
jgi:hypothetical protein